MSGGSYNYAFRYVDDMADELSRQDDPLRRAFSKQMKLMARAMQAIEWVDSCDCSHPHDSDAIKKVLGASADQLAMAEIVDDAKEVSVTLNAAIDKAQQALGAKT